MELERCINQLSLDKDNNEGKRNIKNIALVDLNKKCFKNTLEDMINRQKRLGRAARDEAEIKKVESKNRVDAAVNKLASFFNIGANLMLSMLQSIGISPEDLIDPNKMQMVIDKLKKYFLLSDKKVEELIDLLEAC